jgi:uncharacterized protein (DUF58 family)
MKRPSGLVVGAPASTAGAGAVLAFTLAAETRDVWLQVAGCGLVGLLVVSWLSVVFDAGCDVTMEHAGDLVVGQPVEVCFTVENRHRRRSRPMLIRYSLTSTRPLLPQTTVYLDPLAAGTGVQVSANVTPTARGQALSGSWSIERLGAFGMFAARHARATTKRVRVAPAPTAPLDLAVGAGSSHGSSRLRPGLDVWGAREWRPGDAMRHVHWRSTARTGKLTVVESGEPARAALGVIIAGRSGEPDFEAMLALAASTVGRAVDDGADCYAWLEQERAGCIGRLRPDSFITPFVIAESALLPSEQAVRHLLEHIGPGGTLLVVASDTSWRDAFGAAAAASDLEIVDVAAFL